VYWNTAIPVCSSHHTSSSNGFQPKERSSLQPKERSSLQPKERSLQPKERSLQPKERSLTVNAPEWNISGNVRKGHPKKLPTPSALRCRHQCGDIVHGYLRVLSPTSTTFSDVMPCKQYRLRKKETSERNAVDCAQSWDPIPSMSTTLCPKKSSPKDTILQTAAKSPQHVRSMCNVHGSMHCARTSISYHPLGLDNTCGQEIA
jgi:hypothetical protein